MGASGCYPRKAPKVSRLLETLSHSLRREVLHYFENFGEETTSLDELVAHVDGRVPDTDTDELRTALVHAHLPKLQTRGWLDFDPRTGAIRYHGHDSAEELLCDVTDVFAE